MRKTKTKGDGFGSIAKSLGSKALKAAAPVLIKEGSKMATQALQNQIAGQGFGSIAKSLGSKALKAAAPVLIKEGSKMATQALQNQIAGQGITRGRHKKLDSIPRHSGAKSKVVNPRIKPLNRTLNIGIPQVSHGGSFGSFGYAR
jgi:hypothetical protein